MTKIKLTLSINKKKLLDSILVYTHFPSVSQTFFVTVFFKNIGNITEHLLKLILNTMKEMFHLTKLMS